MVSATKGVLLLGFGGPDTPDAIEPFVTNILGGKRLPPPVMAKIKERYDLIGGASPLVAITKRQAQKLEEALNTEAGSFKVYVGMLHWHPFISSAINDIREDGINSVVAVSTAPFFSRVSTGAYAEEVTKVLDGTDATLGVSFAPTWHNHPLFIKAMVKRVQDYLDRFSGEDHVQVIFSAHSLPIDHIQTGDPYETQFRETVQLIIDHFPHLQWHLAYQSKGGGQGAWLGPDVEDVMEDLAANGKKNVLVVPVGFISDHVETLYDIDIAMKNKADALGLNFVRSLALNDEPLLIDALADLIRKHT